MNDIIDKKLPASRPRFHREEVIMDGRSTEFWRRDILEGIRALYGDPEYASELLTEPVRLFTDETKETRLYNQMNTGDWWWNAQVRVVNDTGPGNPAGFVPVPARVRVRVVELQPVTNPDPRAGYPQVRPAITGSFNLSVLPAGSDAGHSLSTIHHHRVCSRQRRT